MVHQGLINKYNVQYTVGENIIGAPNMRFDYGNHPIINFSNFGIAILNFSLLLLLKLSIIFSLLNFCYNLLLFNFFSPF